MLLENNYPSLCTTTITARREWEKSLETQLIDTLSTI